MKHTPGPWHVEKKHHRMRVAHRVGEPGFREFRYRHITPDWHEQKSGAKRGEAPSYYGWHAQDEANARLIAAAPDLLAACEAFMYEWRTVLESDFHESPLGVVAERCLEAIAKAKT